MQGQPAGPGELFYASYPSYSLEALLLSLTLLLAFGRSLFRVSETPHVLSDSHRSRGFWCGSRGSWRCGRHPDGSSWRAAWISRRSNRSWILRAFCTAPLPGSWPSPHDELEGTHRPPISSLAKKAAVNSPAAFRKISFSWRRVLTSR